MCEIREEIKRLLKELGMTQTDLARLLTKRGKYRVNSQELCTFLGGYDSPKANRALTDALALLVNERDYRENLVRRARREEPMPGTNTDPVFS